MVLDWASQVVLVVKNSLAHTGRLKRCGFNPTSWEDPLEEGVATQSSILASRIQRTEEPGRLRSIGSHRAGNDRATNTLY